jgi:hypothetical protein
MLDPGKAGRPVNLSAAIISFSLHDVENDSSAENIGLGVIALVLEKFWSDIAWRAAPKEETLPGLDLRGEAEVSYLEVVVVVFAGKDEIFGLQVAVDDAQVVEVVEREQKVLHHVHGIFLLVAPL